MSIPNAKKPAAQTSFVAFAAACLTTLLPGSALADPPTALPWTDAWPDRTYEPAFDYDSDGCYPTPAIGRDGNLAPGLEPSGAPNGQCHDSWDLDNTNSYSRSKCNSGWCAFMFALYFEKDQVGAAGGGHRHDWEHVVVWVPDNGWPAYVSVSQHGKYKTYTRNQVAWDDTGKHPKVIYHKEDGQFDSHVLRIAGFNEQPENHKHAWQYPPVVGWHHYPSGFRDKLMGHNFGAAQLDLRDCCFNGALRISKPQEIPFNPDA